MLPKGPWGWYRNGGIFCASCKGERGSPHTKDCVTLQVQTVFAEVVGALRLVEDPQSRDLASTVNAVRAALAAVEKLGKGE